MGEPGAAHGRGLRGMPSPLTHTPHSDTSLTGGGRRTGAAHRPGLRRGVGRAGGQAGAGPPAQAAAHGAERVLGHAAALARAATVAGIPSFIVMPSNAPEIKKKAVKGYGGEIIECEPNLKARESTLEAVVARTGATFIPPYDFLDVIEGQATCALEFLEDQSDLDILMAPVGGGGLLGGTALTAHYLNPQIEVIAGEPAGADDAYRSFHAGYLIPQTGPNTIADGLLTSLGTINFALIQAHVRDILLATDPQIIDAMRLVYERMKIIIEPSCAVPLAALLANKVRFAGKKVGIILSGGNVDLGKLPF
ncbi:MAG: pyridoxal-phosphate dependent enzyme [Algoriphagus sp.]